MSQPHDIATRLLSAFPDDPRKAFEFINVMSRAFWRLALQTGNETSVVGPLLPSDKNHYSFVGKQRFIDYLGQATDRFCTSSDEAVQLLLELFPSGEPVSQATSGFRHARTSPGFGGFIDGHIIAISRRIERNEWVPGRAKLLEIIQYACRSFIPPLLLDDLYWKELRRAYGITDSVDFLDYALRWCECINNIGRSIISYDELMSLARTEEPATLHDEWAECLTELAESVEIIRPVGDPNKGSAVDYHIEHRADGSFLFPRLFGVSTGVEGLDYLLFSGLWLPRLGAHRGPSFHVGADCNAPSSLPDDYREQCSIVIAGNPGMGKTTLALSIAAMLAARGGLALYFRFELEEKTLLRQFIQFHRKVQPFLEIVSAFPDRDNPKHRWPGGGVLSFKFLPPSDIEALEVIVDDVVSAWANYADDAPADCLKERVAVFDTVNALSTYGEDISRSRRLLRSITNRLNSLGFAVIFLVEGNKPDFDHHFVDVDIRLDDLASKESPDVYRAISVAKTRVQASHRGNHVYHINAEQGMSVHPSSIAVLTARRRRNSQVANLNSARRAKIECIDPGIRSFAKYFSTHLESDSDKGSSSSVSWWHPGSVTTLAGPRGSLKSNFSTVFAKSLTEEELRHYGSSMLLRFSEAGAISLPHSSTHVVSSHSYARITEYSINSRTAPERTGTLVDVLIRSGHIAPGDVLEIVRSTIRRRKSEGSRFCRAVIQAVGNIQADFPAIYEDRSFIPALREIFWSNAVTLLLVCSTPEESADYPSSVSDQLFGMSDNIIKLTSHEVGNESLTAIHVERSSDSSHKRGTHELKRWSCGELSGLEIQPSFDLVDHPRSKLGDAARIEVDFVFETKCQQQYAIGLKERLFETSGYVVSARELGLDSPESSPIEDFSRKQLRIRMVDASLLYATDDKASLHLLPVTDLGEEHESLVKSLTFPGGETPPIDEMSTIPFFSNPSFLVASSELRDFLRSEHAAGNDVGRRLLDGLGDYSWSEIIGVLRKFSQQCNYEPARLFSIFSGGRKQENASCFFLEVLLAEALQQDVVSVNFGQQAAHTFVGTKQIPALCENEALVRSTITHLCSLLWGVKQLQMPIDQAGCTQATSNFALSRKWYATFRQYSDFTEALFGARDTGLHPLRLPGNVWSNGDWHLGISAESIGISKGIQIITKEFLSEEASLDRLYAGVGLPVQKSIFDSARDSTVAGLPLSWFVPYINSERVIARSKIVRYAAARRIVMNLMAYVASLDNFDPNDENHEKTVEKLVSTFQSEIRIWCRNVV